MELAVQSINTYFGLSHILFDVSLNVDRGEVVVLLKDATAPARPPRCSASWGLIRPRPAGWFTEAGTSPDGRLTKLRGWASATCRRIARYSGNNPERPSGCPPRVDARPVRREYAPADAPKTVHAVADVKDALYLAVQLAAREFVAGVTLDELLEGRDTFTRYLEAQVQPRAETFGVRLHRVGVKDVILPGEMKTLLNKVIEAEKAAAANVITRREDAAATRNMAQPAKVIAENPELVQKMTTALLKGIRETLVSPDKAFAASLKAVPEAGGENEAINRAIFDASLDIWQAAAFRKVITLHPELVVRQAHHDQS